MDTQREFQSISTAEWRIMKLLWEKAPRGSQEIIKELSLTETWAPTTVKTLLSRLVKKGVLGYEEQNRQYGYFPLVDESTCTRQETQSLLDKVFSGLGGRMISSFVEDSNLSKSELEELRELLDKKIRQSGD